LKIKTAKDLAILILAAWFIIFLEFRTSFFATHNLHSGPIKLTIFLHEAFGFQFFQEDMLTLLYVNTVISLVLGGLIALLPLTVAALYIGAPSKMKRLE